jgi:hypothetical protein
MTKISPDRNIIGRGLVSLLNPPVHRMSEVSNRDLFKQMIATSGFI